MSVVEPTILDFGRIVLNLISYFYRFYDPNKECRYKPVDVSLQIVKLPEGLSER
jgi:hypothetical protein